MTTYLDPTKETFGRFKDLPTNDGPIHMLNLVRLHEKAIYPDGRTASGQEAYRAYADAAARCSSVWAARRSGSARRS